MVTDRDSRGRFVKGNQAAKSGNGGRPPKNREERYYEITVTTCTFDEWERIIKKAVAQALRGDHVARKFLADYLVGVPAQDHNVYFDVEKWKEIEKRQLEQVSQLDGA